MVHFLPAVSIYSPFAAFPTFWTIAVFQILAFESSISKESTTKIIEFWSFWKRHGYVKKIGGIRAMFLFSALLTI
jgi:hypothetical protein